MPVPARQGLTDMAKGLIPLYALCDTILKPDGSVSSVTITLLNGQAQRQLSDPIWPPCRRRPRLLFRRAARSSASSSKATPQRQPLNQRFLTILATGMELCSSMGANQNSIATESGVVPLDAPADMPLGKFPIDSAFHFLIYHTPTGGGSDVVDCGENWSALRVLGRFGGKPVDVGQVWRVSLRPGEPTAVWLQINFETPLPALEAWPTVDSLGLRDFAGP